MSLRIESDENNFVDSDYENQDAGRGLVALLKERGCDFSGPALELGCGEGALTLGLVAVDAYPAVLVTDPSEKFLRLARRKLTHHQLADTGKVFFAKLDGDQIGSLPEKTFSMIIFRASSRDTNNFGDLVAEAARVLRPGGVLVSEESLAEGFFVMGLLTQFIPVIISQSGKSISSSDAERLKSFGETMKFYLRDDLPQSSLQMRHLPKVEEMVRFGNRCGLFTEFFSNLTLSHFVTERSLVLANVCYYNLLRKHLRDLVGTSEELIESLDQSFAPYARFIEDATQGGGGPPVNGVFLWRKPGCQEMRPDLRKTLSIAIFNTYDLQGGAAVAAWRLHLGLRQSENNSQMFVLHKISDDKDIQGAVVDSSLASVTTRESWISESDRWIDRQRTPLSETFFSPPIPGYDWSRHPDVRHSEIIHLHWVTGMLSPAAISALQSLGKPVVWTLHDQRAFTGGCHYTAGCVGYRADCTACPQLNATVFDLPCRVLQETIEKIDATQITVVCPSRWLADCAKQSVMFRHSRIEVIPYGIETDVYTPRDRVSARVSLGLPVDGFFFLFGAASLKDRRKGIHVLYEAVRICRSDPAFESALLDGQIRFLSYGWNPAQQDSEGPPVNNLGYVADPEKMAMIYAASDIYICPTLEDNLPNTILESLGCGRPVIGSDVGGVSDLVRHAVNGLLVPPNDPDALSDAMLRVMKSPDVMAAWSIAAREGVEANHSLKHQAESYVKLYQDLLLEAKPMPQDLPAPLLELPLLPAAWEFSRTRIERSAAADKKLQIQTTQNQSTDMMAQDTTSINIANFEQMGWPYSAPPQRPMPENLPSGRSWPRISIVTPSYNQGQYIEQTILSIVNQNYPNVEHIVMDGGSTDETVEILKKYSMCLAYWASEKDRGQSHAINKGFTKATGEIVTWLNSDDLLAPGALFAIALAFDSSEADLVAGVCQLHRDGEIFDQHLTCCVDGPLPLSELLDLDNHWLAGQFFYQPEVFFKRDLLLSVGGNVSEEMFWGMDYELWVRFAQAGARLKVIGCPIAQYRVHDEQKTHDVDGFSVELRAYLKKLRSELQLPETPLPYVGRKRKLRIVYFNDIGFRYGAGIAHHRLARAAQVAGHEVIPVAIGFDNLTDLEKEEPIAQRVIPYIKGFLPDVVVVGNVHGADLDPACLKELADVFPTVFVLHDCWILSGRCAYRGGCDKYLTGCDETCPTPSEYPRLNPLLIATAWQKKMDFIQNASKLVLGANSFWSKRQTENLGVALQAPACAPVRRPLTVRYGLPLEVFYPRDAARSRELLRLPANKFILLFSCANLGDKRKGGHDLVQALRKLNLPDLVPVCIGHYDNTTVLDLPELVKFGAIYDLEQQALLYSAADLFVGPSLEEAFGQVYIEAAACGTPSICYPVDGAPEAVIDGIVGRVAKNVGPDALADAIMELYSNHQLRTNLGWWGRYHVASEFSLEASCRTLFFAFREAIRLAGGDLEPKLKISPKPPQMPPVKVLLEPLTSENLGSVDRLSPDQFDVVLADYYQQQVKSFRGRSTPWWLKPKAWLARINRNNLRKKIARNARKRKTASDHAKKNLKSD